MPFADVVVANSRHKHADSEINCACTNDPASSLAFGGSETTNSEVSWREYKCCGNECRDNKTDDKTNDDDTIPMSTTEPDGPRTTRICSPEDA